LPRAAAARQRAANRWDGRGERIGRSSAVILFGRDYCGLWFLNNSVIWRIASGLHEWWSPGTTRTSQRAGARRAGGELVAVAGEAHGRGEQ